jgi:high-affinity K+ transport system ATPase subunit B
VQSVGVDLRAVYEENGALIDMFNGRLKASNGESFRSTAVSNVYGSRFVRETKKNSVSLGVLVASLAWVSSIVVILSRACVRIDRVE